jgi:hypothetical protein
MRNAAVQSAILIEEDSDMVNLSTQFARLISHRNIDKTPRPKSTPCQMRVLHISNAKRKPVKMLKGSRQCENYV